MVLLLLSAVGAACRPRPLAGPPDNPMQLEIVLPTQVGAGRPVAIELRLANPGPDARDVVLQGRPPAFDIRITHEDGRHVWRRLEGEVVTTVLQLLRVEPGEDVVLGHVWDQRDGGGNPVPAGEYLVTAELPTDPPAVFRAGPAHFTIVP